MFTRGQTGDNSRYRDFSSDPRAKWYICCTEYRWSITNIPAGTIQFSNSLKIFFSSTTHQKLSKEHARCYRNYTILRELTILENLLRHLYLHLLRVIQT